MKTDHSTGPLTDETVAKLHEWIDANIDLMVSALQGAVQIPSVQSDPAPGAPYGVNCRAALDYTLNLCASLGFDIHNDEGYAGHAEFGTGDEMVAALGHLDVVPEGDGWTLPPYGAVLQDGYIYGRGSADDKGPSYAALFAATALLKLNIPLSRRIRLVFGCNEESGFGCVHHYWEVSKNERPVAAFTPDAGFPLIYAEKGIANIIIEKPTQLAAGGLSIAHFEGGRRPNMVPDYARALIKGGAAELDGALAELSKFWDRNVISEWTSDGVVVIAIGKSAHGAGPDAGDNAISRLARALLSLKQPEWNELLSWINTASETTGHILGIAHTDDIAGPLTSNLGVAETTDTGLIRLTYNIRYPVTWSIHLLLANLQLAIDKAGWALVEHFDQPPLYVSLDQEPVATLLRVYREETGDLTSEPRTMGGGTYARATPHAIAYGPSFPGGNDGPAHEPDEKFSLQTYTRAAKIYSHALFELAR